ncbi:rare lipoprotein A [Hydrogenophaga taeniospiralis CCUG 15921]|uniref:Endolytic peptidoglycan transglycosylase RlpA n=1 Tax=Hydrogenophaga taeniospiralis CCUG 15921 TaxID=1281780 RepID=A0A9X4SBJ5_9BURK|nr:septal ring lytic transglycosylase RlpA family protein [Hydrogenophaga taeniospiralis]MDG5975513.1 rare lipoprotein A [Hydrogenophaga taeniospiralis CCUG 15921]
MPTAPNPAAGRLRLAITLLAALVAACAGPSPVPVDAPDGQRPGPAVRSTAPPADLPATASTPSPAPGIPEPATAAVPPVDAAPAAPSAPDQLIDQGLASWYGKRFHGRRTASGERYDMHAFTAAHRTLPFGTRVRVRSVHTGKEVLVRINDRGPFRRGRVIDLSRAAINALGLRQRGVTTVELLRE